MSGIEAHLVLARPDFSLDVDLALPGRGVSALFGPSGAGKTSVLRAIAGLERAAGFVRINGATWQDDSRNEFVPTHKRPLGYVFQEASLFPHLDVRRNLEYGMNRVPAAGRRVSLQAAIDLLGIGALMDRDPATLSGGERQRVAIARALATSPSLLLLDEPLAALDAARKSEVLPYLERLHDQWDIPVLYVSHALDEVARIADHLVLMDKGRVAASGPIDALLARSDLRLIEGDGAAAWIEGTVADYDAAYHLLAIDCPGGRFLLPGSSRSAGTRVRLKVQARDVSLALEKPTGSSIINILPVRVIDMRDEARGQVVVALALGSSRIFARVTRKSADALDLRPGREVYAQIKGIAVVD
ncbi:MAG: molybdenum ABC transporter ATP-binding protein [Rhodospirillales bacterium]|nr:molybdenum ABC transporter ATP-binding protein [Rhodospirillales bacterium]